MNPHDNKEKTEVEVKFTCPEGYDLAAILNAVHTMGIKCVKEAPCFQTDAYLDTPEYTLLKAGIGLRIRQRGETHVGAYKSSGKQQDALFERQEFEWTLSSDEIKLWTGEKKPTIPPAVVDKLNIQGKPLRKVLVVETNRHSAILSGSDGLKAELSLDEVIFRGHRGLKPYREIEIELLHGQIDHLKQIAKGLQNQLALQPAVHSKYKIGMLLVGKYGAGEVKAQSQ